MLSLQRFHGSVCVYFVILTAGTLAEMPTRQSAGRPLRVLLVPTSPEKVACPSVSAAAGVRFEVDGRREGVAEWPTDPAAYAFIAIDANRNGIIDNATELVSDRMSRGETGAFNVLVYDIAAKAPNLPVIDASHPAHATLVLWRDANRNGRSELSELRAASEFLATIGLGMSAVTSEQRLETPCRYKGFSVTVADWTGRPMPNDRYHPIYEVLLRTP